MTSAAVARPQRTSQTLAGAAMSPTHRAEVSTKEKLRAEKRIQDDPVILLKLGFSGDIPAIPKSLLEECAKTGGTLVLRFKTTVLEYQAKLNDALGPKKKHLGLVFVEDGAKTIAITSEEPAWINVPNTVRDDTLELTKSQALSHVKNSRLCDPMHTVLLLGYNNLETGQQMPGFKDKWTFTNRECTVVGSAADGIRVNFAPGFDLRGNFQLGLASLVFRN